MIQTFLVTAVARIEAQVKYQDNLEEFGRLSEWETFSAPNFEMPPEQGS